MPVKPKLSFDELVASRQLLKTFCQAHYDSLITFAGKTAFKLHQSEASVRPDSHLSSTATCIESLLDCPDTFLPPKREGANRGMILDRVKTFALAAIKRKDWESEGSAQIYCRCRTLPLVISYLLPYRSRITPLLIDILSQLTDSARLAIGEASSKRDDWYPPNAYHTYWTLYILNRLAEHFPVVASQLDEKLKNAGLTVKRIQEEMLTWARQVAGNQIALHSSESSTLDSDQLAWSLAIVLRFDSDFQSNLSKQNFICYGLKCLFEHQTNDGNWRTGGPLFHYKNAGNAYCYVFETFAILLKATLTRRKEGIFLRQALLPYAGNLLELLRYSKATRIPLAGDSEIFGWSSGHRANRKDAESWATASVYSFSQGLRQLMGIWTREAAAEQLRVNSSRQSTKDAIADLSKRGDTWTKDGSTAACQLMTLYVNPVRFFGSGIDLEPDSQPIDKDQARAAILFGPPGTSKTTLSRSIAGAIGWNYVELHASHFVADGLPNVQRTADKIFGELMQLDRTVILFDEIDELVRSREIGGDSFGRFLTTSMLPKLAELLKGRRVIYFVATNHIDFFDSAITRAERFDALVHVSPPSFDRKLKELKKLLKLSFKRVRSVGFTKQQVDKVFLEAAASEKAKPGEPSSELPDTCVLAKFLLMRWDQLNELAAHIREFQKNRKEITLTRELLKNVLSKLADPSLKTCAPFKSSLDAGKYEQHDFSKVGIWEVRGDMPTQAKQLLKKSESELHCNEGLHSREGLNWYVSRTGFDDFSALPCKCEIIAPGIIKLLPNSI